MSSPNLAAITCWQCGQSKIDSDGLEHPMIHIAFGGLEATEESTKSLHLDCLPAHVAAAYRPQFGPAIDAAHAGVRGDELRSLIAKSSDEFDVRHAAQVAAAAAEKVGA